MICLIDEHLKAEFVVEKLIVVLHCTSNVTH